MVRAKRGLTLSRSDDRKVSNDDIFSDAAIKRLAEVSNLPPMPIAPFSAISCAALRSSTAKRLAGRPPRENSRGRKAIRTDRQTDK